MSRPARTAAGAGDEAEQQAEALAVSIALVSLAGWSDGLGYIRFNGLFVSVMSGNTTKTGAMAGHDGRIVANSSHAIVAFVLGVVIGELVGSSDVRWARALILLCITLTLAAAAGSQALAAPEYVVAPLLSVAMGIVTAAVHKAEGLSMSLTYVTGTLVNLGRGIADGLLGRKPWRAAAPYAALWLGFFMGAVGGAFTARRSALIAMILAVCAAAAMTLWSLVQVELFRKAAR